MSAEKSFEKLRGETRYNFQGEQRNVILSDKNEFEANGRAKAEHSGVSNDGLDFSFFDNPFVKIMIRMGRHQPYCPLF